MKTFKEGFTGSLKIFKAPDVLQLIATQRKTGVVYFYEGEDEAAVGFEDGNVVAAYIVKKGKFETLESYLIRSGYVTTFDVETAKKIQEETGEPLEEILVKEKIISSEDLEEIITFKIQEVIDEIITWTTGIYKFVPGKEIYKFSKFKITIPVEKLIIEAIRRQDEWGRIKEKIRDSSMIFEKVEDRMLLFEEKLEKDEKKVIGYVNGKRTVDEIVDLTGIGRFRTYFALYKLYDKGIIKPVADTVRVLKKKRKKRREIKKKEVKKIPAVLTYAVFVVLLLFLILGSLGKRNIFLPKFTPFVPSVYVSDKER